VSLRLSAIRLSHVEGDRLIWSLPTPYVWFIRALGIWSPLAGRSLVTAADAEDCCSSAYAPFRWLVRHRYNVFLHVLFALTTWFYADLNRGRFPFLGSLFLELILTALVVLALYCQRALFADGVAIQRLYHLLSQLPPTKRKHLTARPLWIVLCVVRSLILTADLLPRSHFSCRL
jgi:hypothetical protein